MAGDWIKAEKSTPRKPEVLRVAAALGIDPDEAFGKCFRFWAWLDDHFAICNASGVTETESVALPGVTAALIDSLAGGPGFAAAMIEVGWLTSKNGVLEVPNFDRHLSQSAKARGLVAKRVAKHRGEECNGEIVTPALPEKRGGRGEKNFQSGKAPIGEDGSPPVARPRLKNSSSGGKAKAPEDHVDLAGLNWEAVCNTAVAVAKRVPAKSLQDRRAWLRYSVMAVKKFSENWILDAAEAASKNELDGNRQAYFVAALQSKAEEFEEDFTPEAFNKYAEGIEIPDRIWKVKIVPVETRK